MWMFPLGCYLVGRKYLVIAAYEPQNSVLQLVSRFHVSNGLCLLLNELYFLTCQKLCSADASDAQDFREDKLKCLVLDSSMPLHSWVASTIIIILY